MPDLTLILFYLSHQDQLILLEDTRSLPEHIASLNTWSVPIFTFKTPAEVSTSYW